MNRRGKIIVSITGIILISLFLIALTYGYYITKIKGNSNSSSITATTADLSLVYGDGNGTIGSASNTIKPGDEIGSKTFTVKNEGDATTSYVVVIEDVLITDYSINKTNLEDESVGFVSNDFRYTLTCESDGEVCNGISDETVFPMSGGIVVGNNIEVGKTQTFTLTVVYKETGEEQSDDMNKGLTAKVNIKDIKEINPYSDNTSTLAYNIINNAKLDKNGTELKAIPDTIPAVVINNETEKVLSIVQDDYGASYYYRGNIKDNYVNFIEMCWRIVRIEGDGAIKLVLEDQDETCSKTMNGNWNIATGAYGYIYDDATSQYRITYTGYTGGMADSMQDFQENKIADYTGKLKSGDWCYDDTAYQDEAGTTLISNTSSYYANGTNFYYGANTRLVNKKQPSLKCNGTNMTKFSDETDMYVATLTADEIVLAGGKTGANNTNYYLINDYQKSESLYWWLLSPSYFGGGSDVAFRLDSYGYVRHIGVYYTGSSVRPAVSLKAGTEISSGDGSIDNPYIVK